MSRKQQNKSDQLEKFLSVYKHMLYFVNLRWKYFSLWMPVITNILKKEWLVYFKQSNNLADQSKKKAIKEKAVLASLPNKGLTSFYSVYAGEGQPYQTDI